MYKITDKKLETIKNTFMLKEFELSDGKKVKRVVFSDEADSGIRDDIIMSDDWEVNDNCYRFASNAIDHFIDTVKVGEYEELDEIFEEVRDRIEPDVYTSDLTEWLHENVNHVYYLTDAIENYSPKDGFELLKLAQNQYIEAVYTLVLDAIEGFLECDEE